MAKKKTAFTTSVKLYKEGINSEKQQMGAYAKKMGTSVRSLQGESKKLQGEFKRHSKEMHEAGRNMIAEGNKNMHAKVGKFRGEIRDQLKENQEAVSRMGNSIRFFLSEVNKKKKDFHAYQRGPFQGYIKAFWG